MVEAMLKYSLLGVSCTDCPIRETLQAIPDDPDDSDIPMTCE